MKTKSILKLLFYICIIFALNYQTQAQTKEFAPVGAKWYYSFHDMVMPVVTYSTLVCYNDTVILGVNTKQISGGYFVFENNKQIFLYQPQINDFTLLYDFNKNTGETWDVVTPMWGVADTFTVIVDSIDIEIINNDTIKVQYIRSLDMLWSFDGKTIEYIGNTMYLFPQYGLADPHTGPLRCYEDVDYTYHPMGIPCDTIYIVYTPEKHPEKYLSIAPNFARDYISINVRSTCNQMYIQIFDLYGRLWYEKEINQQTQSIFVGDLPKGINFVKLNCENKMYIEKFLKY